MTIAVTKFQQLQPFVGPDGRLTREAVLWLSNIVAKFAEIDVAATADAAELADHEDRITALEP